MPTLIRVSEIPESPEGTEEYRTRVFLQLAFTSTGRNQKVETLKDFRLSVKPIDAPGSVEFMATSFGEFVDKGEASRPGESRSLAYRYVADPGALTVAPNEGRVPIVAFGRQDVLTPPLIEAGTGYQLSVTAKRTSSWSGPLALFRPGSPTPLRGCIKVRAPKPNEVTRWRDKTRYYVPLSTHDEGCDG